MDNNEKTKYVWFGLVSFINRIRNHLVAATFIIEQGNVEKNVFLETFLDVLSQQILSELAKLFDRAHYGSEDNCSVLQLKELCVENKIVFPDGENDEVIQQCVEICERYKQVVPKEVRNKQIAHIDLATLYNEKPVKISFSDLKDVVEDLAHLITQIGERLYLGELNFPPVSLIEAQYQAAFNEIVH